MNRNIILKATLLAALTLGAHGAARAQEAENPATLGVLHLEGARLENLELAYDKVAKRPIGSQVQAPGTVCLNEEHVMTVVPRIRGLVVKDYQKLGGQVAEGDPLFRMESSDLASALMEHADSEQNLRFARELLEQEQRLFDRNVSSAEQLNEKKRELRLAEVRHTASLQPLKMLHITEPEANRMLENLENADFTGRDIVAPVAGEVIAKNLKLGAEVEAEVDVYTLANLSTLWVDFYLPLGSAGQVKAGMSVRVLATVGAQEGQGEVIYVAPLAEEGSRTVLARAVLDNADGQWRPGTPVRVAITGDAGEAVLSVPAGAVLDLGENKAVWIREGESVFRAVPVELGRSDGANVEVLHGLSAGQTVVTRNAAQLKGELELGEG